VAFRAVELLLREGKPTQIFDACGVEAKVGDYVIVERDELRDFGQVVREPYDLDERYAPPTPGVVLFVASGTDLEAAQGFRAQEAKAWRVVREKVRDHELDMKLIACEYASDGSKLKIYYTADKRVDFRELVRDLAHEFRTRIEMKQIGVRDGSGMIGGFGDCGRELCCATWLREFHPISVKMAKDQGVALNPTKITGVCGRLKCCLAYEVEHYRESKRRFPRIGSRCESCSLGEVIIKACNPLRDTVTVIKENKLVDIIKNDDPY
jgi:cell fate regulator YaaT (PSP1 superfamily)